TAAYDHDVLALGGDLRRTVTLTVPVRRHQVLHREVDTGQVATGRRRVVPAAQRTHGEHHGVVTLPQILDGDVDTHLAAGDERRALVAQLRQPSVEDLLLHLELGDAVPQQPSEPIVALEDRHLVARTRQLLRRRQPGRTRTDDRDLPARRLLRRARLDVTGLPRLRRDRLLDPLDRDRPTGQRPDRQG